jgi:hypothetical protein
MGPSRPALKAPPPPDTTPYDPCRADCRRCELGKDDRSTDPVPPVAGARLAAASLVLFLVPLILALLGSISLRQAHALWQLLGAVAGFTIGIAAARLLVGRIIVRKGSR